MTLCRRRSHVHASAVTPIAVSVLAATAERCHLMRSPSLHGHPFVGETQVMASHPRGICSVDAITPVTSHLAARNARTPEHRLIFRPGCYNKLRRHACMWRCLKTRKPVLRRLQMLILRDCTLFAARLCRLRRRRRPLVWKPLVKIPS